MSLTNFNLRYLCYIHYCYLLQVDTYYYFPLLRYLTHILTLKGDVLAQLVELQVKSVALAKVGGLPSPAVGRRLYAEYTCLAGSIGRVNTALVRQQWGASSNVIVVTYMSHHVCVTKILEHEQAAASTRYLSYYATTHEQLLTQLKPSAVTANVGGQHLL